MFFWELLINLKDDKQRREKEWREKVKTKLLALSWDLTSEGESRRWSYFREEEVKQGNGVLRLMVARMCGMARQVRKEIYMAETLNQVKKVVSEPEINKGYCYHFRVCMMWLALLQRCGKMGGCIIQMGLTGKQSSNKVMATAAVLGRRLVSSLSVKQCWGRRWW